MSEVVIAVIVHVSIDLLSDHMYLCSSIREIFKIEYSNVVTCEKHLRWIITRLYMWVIYEKAYCIFCIQVYGNKLRYTSPYNLTVWKIFAYMYITTHVKHYFPREFWCVVHIVVFFSCLARFQIWLPSTYIYIQKWSV